MNEQEQRRVEHCPKCGLVFSTFRTPGVPDAYLGDWDGPVQMIPCTCIVELEELRGADK